VRIAADKKYTLTRTTRKFTKKGNFYPQMTQMDADEKYEGVKENLGAPGRLTGFIHFALATNASPLDHARGPPWRWEKQCFV